MRQFISLFVSFCLAFNICWPFSVGYGYAFTESFIYDRGSVVPHRKTPSQLPHSYTTHTCYWHLNITQAPSSPRGRSEHVDINFFLARESKVPCSLFVLFLLPTIASRTPSFSPLFFRSPLPGFPVLSRFFHAQRASRTNPHVPKFLGFPKGNFRTSGRAF